ncbi:MAG: glycosyltransferase family 9 protein [Ignavibacteriae bacterium]|nr:glycosyltransferase family 9 protein [Ignavibacteriota bacterium]
MEVFYLNCAFLGDVALTLYLIQAIRNIHPAVDITIVTTPQASSLATCAKAINNVVTYDKRGLQTGFRGIKFISSLLLDKKVDCIIAPHRSLRTTLLTFLSHPIYSVSFTKSTLSILYKKRIVYQNHLHESERNLSLLNSFSDVNIKQVPVVELEFDDDDKSFIDYKIYGSGIRDNDKIILAAPGSIWKTKRWEEEYFINLCSKLSSEGYKMILIGSKDDRELCSRIAMNSGSLNFAGETSLPQTLVLMMKSNLTITNDSSPTHFAQLAGCPVLTIFGPTSPKFGFAPIGEKSNIVELNELKCRPCTIHGSHKCPIGTHECMTKINPQMVYNTAISILKI